MKCEKWSRGMSRPFHPQLPGVCGYKKKRAHPYGHAPGGKAAHTHSHSDEKRAHVLSHSQGADPGETRLISLFTPDLTKSHALQMKRAALYSSALCAANKA